MATEKTKRMSRRAGILKNRDHHKRLKKQAEQAAHAQRKAARAHNMELASRLAREGKISTSTAASIHGCSTKAAQRSGGPSAILGVMTEDDMVDMDLVIGVAHFGLEEETGPGVLEGAAFLWGLGAGGVADGEGEGEEEEEEEEQQEEEEEEGADDDDGEGRDGAGGFQQQTSLPFRPFK